MAAAADSAFDLFGDSDSAFGDSDNGESSTASISSDVIDYPVQNGRRYHAYCLGTYVFPNDELEQERMDMQHSLFVETLGKLYAAPIHDVHRVLDVGTGTGIWALDFADDHPEAEVIGADLSPIQPVHVSPNVRFEVFNIEEDWTYAFKFDFIHGRMLTASLFDWPKLFRQSFDNLNEGGHIEVADICFPVRCADEALPKPSPIYEWSDLMLEACRRAGRPCDNAKYYKGQMEAAGFVNIVQTVYIWPQNGSWPMDNKYKELGRWNLLSMTVEGALDGITMALFTRFLGWTMNDVIVFLTGVRKDILSPEVHVWWPVYVVHGQKPEKRA